MPDDSSTETLIDHQVANGHSVKVFLHDTPSRGEHGLIASLYQTENRENHGCANLAISHTEDANGAVFDVASYTPKGSSNTPLYIASRGEHGLIASLYQTENRENHGCANLAISHTEDANGAVFDVASYTPKGSSNTPLYIVMHPDGSAHINVKIPGDDLPAGFTIDELIDIARRRRHPAQARPKIGSPDNPRIIPFRPGE